MPLEAVESLREHLTSFFHQTLLSINLFLHSILFEIHFSACVPSIAFAFSSLLLYTFFLQTLRFSLATVPYHLPFPLLFIFLLSIFYLFSCLFHALCIFRSSLLPLFFTRFLHTLLHPTPRLPTFLFLLTLPSHSSFSSTYFCFPYYSSRFLHTPFPALAHSSTSLILLTLPSHLFPSPLPSPALLLLFTLSSHYSSFSIPFLLLPIPSHASFTLISISPTFYSPITLHASFTLFCFLHPLSPTPLFLHTLSLLLHHLFLLPCSMRRRGKLERAIGSGVGAFPDP